MKPKKNCREQKGLELRRTHYALGNDQPNYLSQYRHDYPEYPLQGQYGPNMDSVRLRKTNFKLGDYEIPYSTTNMDQSKDILNAGNPAQLDENVKNDLRRSHFILGNQEPNYNTSSQSEFYDKSKLNNLANVDFKNVERSLRSENYVLGNDKPDYISETAAKYTKPLLPKQLPGENNKISTAQLQQSHYVFGTSNDPWVTTHQAAYVPKTIDNKRFTKNLTKTNFILGDAQPTLKSVNQETYVKMPIVSNPLNKELVSDLRKHHFNFGNDNYPDQLTTVNHQDYKDPNVSQLAKANKFDPNFLRSSHWSLGDKGSDPNQYKTTYGIDMVPKTRIPNDPLPNSTFKSGFSLAGNDPLNYSTEQRSNYIPMMNKLDPNDKKLMNNVVKDIKSSHFDLGEMKNDYGTTTGNSYLFNPNTAKNARGNLDKALLNDLRATHYKLGYLPENNQTTYQANYVPLDIVANKGKDPHLRDSHFNLGSGDNAVQDGQTIYMTDYIRKALPAYNDC